MEREKQFIDQVALEQFLTSWKGTFGSFRDVEFTGSGEVLTNSNFSSIVKMFTAIMPKSRLMTTSNLALLSRESAGDLIASGLRFWQVSFDSTDEAEFSEFTGSKSFQKVVDNIKLLHEIMVQDGDKRNYLRIVAHRPYDDNYQVEIKKIRQLLRDYCQEIIDSPYQSLNGRLDADAYNASESVKYDRKKRAVLCNYLWKDLVVVANGDVRVCCSDMFDSKVAFGNIFRESPRDIVDNLNRAKYKKALWEGRPHQLYLCNKCHAPYS
jgi:MoaA/NifB/PqqE/SkfB family radical SAM enzyme